MGRLGKWEGCAAWAKCVDAVLATEVEIPVGVSVGAFFTKEAISKTIFAKSIPDEKSLHFSNEMLHNCMVSSFAFFTNYPDDIKTPYRNYLENQLRTHFKFTGVPVWIFFRKK